MIVFNTDLDNTMIYSYNHNIGDNKKCVEIYNGREISFITNKTYELIKKVKERVLIVPTTTRTTEQYNRIDFGLGVFEYAMTCNGGVLLVNGKEDFEWYNNSYDMIEESLAELEKAEKIFENDINRSFEVRNIRKLFVFTKSSKPQITVELMKSKLDLNLVDVFSNGVKVYVVPKKLTKGKAIERLREKLNPKMVISAGDSEFDVPMLNNSDIAIAHYSMMSKFNLKENTLFLGENNIFSEDILNYILNIIG